MSNKGKFTDRNPNIRAAGRIVEIDQRIGDTLQFYPKEELAETTIKLKCKEKQQKLKQIGQVSHSPHIPEESVGKLMSPELMKTRFLKFREKFMESMFFQKPQLGRVFPSGSKPEHLTNDNTTYGRKTIRSGSLYDLILPRKTSLEVNRDYFKWHDKYIISHNHYFPSEQINRHYVGKYDPTARFGLVHNVDKSGIMVKKALQHCNNLTVIGKNHKKFLDRTQAQLGIRMDRTGLNLDPYQTQGKIGTPNVCDMRALLENRTKCERDSIIEPAIAHVHKMRRYLFKKVDFHMYDLRVLLQSYDKSNTGYITLSDAFHAMRSLLIHCNEEKLRLAAIHFGVVIDPGLPTERVKLLDFWKMLHIQHILPHIGKTKNDLIEDLHDNKETTYRLLCKDRDKPLPAIYSKQKFNKPSDNDRTHVSDLISPSIPLHFGLGDSDFEMVRPKEELRRIFKRLLTDEFDDVWELARNKLNGDENCQISVNDLREAMNLYTKDK